MSTNQTPSTRLDRGFRLAFVLAAAASFMVVAIGSSTFAAKGLKANGYGAALGAPMAQVAGVDLYSPMDYPRWAVQAAGNKNPAVTGPINSASWWYFAWFGCLVTGGLASIVLRRAKPVDETLHGSARWATQEEVEATGLLDLRRED